MRVETLEFFLGLCLGVSLALMYTISTSHTLRQGSLRDRRQAWGPWGLLGGPPGGASLQDLFLTFNDTHSHHDDRTEADKLHKLVRVVCWVYLPRHRSDVIEKQVKVLTETWAKRCNTFLMFGSISNKTLGIVGLNTFVDEGDVTAISNSAFRYIHKHHFSEGDWFLRTTPDSYVAVENLRYFLSKENSSEPVYFGHRYRKFGISYVCSGSSLVLSKETLRRFVSVTKSEPVWQNCTIDPSSGPPEVHFATCLLQLGARLAESLDSLGRSRFHCFDPVREISRQFPDWYDDVEDETTQSLPPSDYAISFRVRNYPQMYGLEFALYHLKPFGIDYASLDLNTH